jgi:hypothetical protein
MRVLKSIGLENCASLIRIAWLDLRCRNDRISMQELRVLCDHVTDEPKKKAPRARSRGIKKPRRPKQSARIIDMGKWRERNSGSQ